MTTPLEEMQFEILPTTYANTGHLFGLGLPVAIDDGGFLPGDDDWSDQDEDNPRTGAVAMGRDFLLGPTHGFNLHVDRATIGEAVDTLDAFKTAWRALHLRDTPGAILPIRYRINNRVRRFYGRPRRFSAPPTNLILSGYVPITADFKCVNGSYYDDVEKSVALTLQQTGQAGFKFPLAFPFTAQANASTAKQIDVGGNADTGPVIRFTGPVTNPILNTGEWILELNTTIPSGSYVELDLRPWAMTVMLNSATSLAGALKRRQYLTDMTFEPGRHFLQFSGAGSGTCTVRWANAWNSY